MEPNGWFCYFATLKIAQQNYRKLRWGDPTYRIRCLNCSEFTLMNSFYFRKWFLLFELVALVTLLDELQMHSPLQIHFSETVCASSFALCESIHNLWILCTKGGKCGKRFHVRPSLRNTSVCQEPTVAFHHSSRRVNMSTVVQCGHQINSFLPSAAYMRQWIGSALVQIMACRLFGAKPLSKKMLRFCQLGT